MLRLNFQTNTVAVMIKEEREFAKGRTDRRICSELPNYPVPLPE